MSHFQTAKHQLTKIRQKSQIIAPLTVLSSGCECHPITDPCIKFWFVDCQCLPNSMIVSLYVWRATKFYKSLAAGNTGAE